MDDITNVDERLKKFEENLKRKKRNKNLLCWIKFNPQADYNYDIIDAEEDVEWMIYEIRKLYEENKQLKEFVDELRRQMEQELGMKKNPPTP